MRLACKRPLARVGHLREHELLLSAAVQDGARERRKAAPADSDLVRATERRRKAPAASWGPRWNRKVVRKTDAEILQGRFLEDAWSKRAL